MSVVSSEEQVIRDYKQTEVGLIPIDWEVKKIGEVSHLSVGGDLDEEKFSEYQDNIYQYPVYSNTVENRGLYGYYKTAEFKGDSVTVVGRGIGIGTAFKRDIEYGAIGRLLVLYPDDKVDSNYLTEIINYRLKVFEESSGIPQLTGVSFAGYKIPLPPTKAEQTTIATALSDADALIQSLEKLIAKKRLIKQGAMQELLKPKGGWVVKKLGEVADLKKGEMITEKTAVRGNVPVIGGGTSTSYYHNKPNRRKNTITISSSGANAGYVSFHGYEIFASDCTTIENNDRYNIQFIYYSLLNKQQKIFSLQTGGAQPHVYPEHLKELEIPIPTNKEKQDYIAEIIKDMDTEIGTLETKLEKYKQIKQGMMQNLLTGKIRLV